MKNRKLAVLLAAVVVSTVIAAPATAMTANKVKEPATVTDPTEIMPLDLDLDGGDISNSATGIEKSLKLNQKNGKYVNLYVENKGQTAIVATINGDAKRTFQRGEKGHIYVEVTQGFLGTDRSYTFKVAPVSGSAAFRYDITRETINKILRISRHKAEAEPIQPPLRPTLTPVIERRIKHEKTDRFDADGDNASCTDQK